MTSLIRTLVICVGFYLFLSVTINKKTIFSHVYSVTSHLTVPTQELTVSLFNKASVSTTAYTKRLFDNSVPKIKDSVRSKAAAPTRGSAAGTAPEETILVEEKEQLDALIKSHD